MQLHVPPRASQPEPESAPDSRFLSRRADTRPDNLLQDAQDLEDTLPFVRLPSAYEEFFEAPTAPGVTLGAGAIAGADLSLNELAAQHDSTFERVLHVVAERVKRLFPTHFPAAPHPSRRSPRGNP